MKLQPQDLRIGNYIQYYDENNIIIDKIKSIWFDDGIEQYRLELFSGKFNNYQVSINGVSPIPLTEELLLKCGFQFIAEEMGYYDFYRYKIEDKYGHSFDFNLHGNDLCEVVNNGNYNYYNYDIHISFKYVHEIQNFIEPIMGKQLEIKL